MRVSLTLLAAAGMVAWIACGSPADARQGVAEKVGEKLDHVGKGVKEGAIEVGEAVRKKFDIVRDDVQGMGTSSRVYSRLHWDKALHTSKIEVHMPRHGVVVLRGIVADPAARQRAETLTGETFGVTDVINELSALNSVEKDAVERVNLTTPRPAR